MKRTLTALAALSLLATQASALEQTTDPVTHQKVTYDVSAQAQSGDLVTMNVFDYITGEERALGDASAVTVTHFDAGDASDVLRR